MTYKRLLSLHKDSPHGVLSSLFPFSVLYFLTLLTSDCSNIYKCPPSHLQLANMPFPQRPYTIAILALLLHSANSFLRRLPYLPTMLPKIIPYTSNTISTTPPTRPTKPSSHPTKTLLKSPGLQLLPFILQASRSNAGSAMLQPAPHTPAANQTMHSTSLHRPVSLIFLSTLWPTKNTVLASPSSKTMTFPISRMARALQRTTAIQSSATFSLLACKTSQLV